MDGRKQYFHLQNSLLAVLLLVLVSPLKVTNSPVDLDEEDGDDFEQQKQFIDDLLDIIKKQIDNVSSIEIPECSLNQQQNFMISNAQFLGLKDLHRDGDPYVHGTEDGSALIMDSRFVIHEAEGRFKFTIKSDNLPPLWPKLHFQFTVNRIRLRIRLYFVPQQETLNITKFEMNEFRGIDVTISGLGPLNPILEKMILITSDIMEKLVAKYIGETIEHYFIDQFRGVIRVI